MKRLKHAAACAVLVPALSFSGTVGAGEGFIGVGGTAAPDYEGGDDYEGGPAVFGKWTFNNGMYGELGGTAEAGQAARLSGNLIPSRWSENWKAGPLLQYRPGRKGVDNDRVDDMENIEHTGEVGAFVGYELGRWDFVLAGSADVGDVHNGVVADLEVGYDWPMNDRWTFSFSGNTSYASGNYMDTYFGVSREDSLRSGLQEYDADGGIKDVGAGVAVHYTPWKHWGILGGVNYYRLVGDADDDSPVVDEGSENQVHGTLAVTYKF